MHLTGLPGHYTNPTIAVQPERQEQPSCLEVYRKCHVKVGCCFLARTDEGDYAVMMGHASHLWPFSGLAGVVLLALLFSANGYLSGGLMRRSGICRTCHPKTSLRGVGEEKADIEKIRAPKKSQCSPQQEVERADRVIRSLVNGTFSKSSEPPFKILQQALQTIARNPAQSSLTAQSSLLFNDSKALSRIMGALQYVEAHLPETVHWWHIFTEAPIHAQVTKRAFVILFAIAHKHKQREKNRGNVISAPLMQQVLKIGWDLRPVDGTVDGIVDGANTNASIWYSYTINNFLQLCFDCSEPSLALEFLALPWIQQHCTLRSLVITIKGLSRASRDTFNIKERGMTYSSVKRVYNMKQEVLKNEARHQKHNLPQSTVNIEAQRKSMLILENAYLDATAKLGTKEDTLSQYRSMMHDDNDIRADSFTLAPVLKMLVNRGFYDDLRLIWRQVSSPDGQQGSLVDRMDTRSRDIVESMVIRGFAADYATMSSLQEAMTLVCRRTSMTTATAFAYGLGERISRRPTAQSQALQQPVTKEEKVVLDTVMEHYKYLEKVYQAYMTARSPAQQQQQKREKTYVIKGNKVDRKQHSEADNEKGVLFWEGILETLMAGYHTTSPGGGSRSEYVITAYFYGMNRLLREKGKTPRSLGDTKLLPLPADADASPFTFNLLLAATTALLEQEEEFKFYYHYRYGSYKQYFDRDHERAHDVRYRAWLDKYKSSPLYLEEVTTPGYHDRHNKNDGNGTNKDDDEYLAGKYDRDDGKNSDDDNEDGKCVPLPFFSNSLEVWNFVKNVYLDRTEAPDSGSKTARPWRVGIGKQDHRMTLSSILEAAGKVNDFAFAHWAWGEACQGRDIAERSSKQSSNQPDTRALHAYLRCFQHREDRNQVTELHRLLKALPHLSRRYSGKKYGTHLFDIYSYRSTDEVVNAMARVLGIEGAMRYIHNTGRVTNTTVSVMQPLPSDRNKEIRTEGNYMLHNLGLASIANLLIHFDRYWRDIASADSDRVKDGLCHATVLGHLLNRPANGIIYKDGDQMKTQNTVNYEQNSLSTDLSLLVAALLKVPIRDSNNPGFSREWLLAKWSGLLAVLISRGDYSHAIDVLNMLRWSFPIIQQHVHLDAETEKSKLLRLQPLSVLEASQILELAVYSALDGSVPLLTKFSVAVTAPPSQDTATEKETDEVKMALSSLGKVVQVKETRVKTLDLLQYSTSSTGADAPALSVSARDIPVPIIIEKAESDDDETTTEQEEEIETEAGEYSFEDPLSGSLTSRLSQLAARNRLSFGDKRITCTLIDILDFLEACTTGSMVCSAENDLETRMIAADSDGDDDDEVEKEKSLPHSRVPIHLSLLEGIFEDAISNKMFAQASRAVRLLEKGYIISSHVLGNDSLVPLQEMGSDNQTSMARSWAALLLASNLKDQKQRVTGSIRGSLVGASRRVGQNIGGSIRGAVSSIDSHQYGDDGAGYE